MPIRRVLLATFIAIAATALLGAGGARADWPDHPVKWVVPFGP
jgi:tripartite-type tricarboxylate transporter receptor subunit TctC